MRGLSFSSLLIGFVALALSFPLFGLGLAFALSWVLRDLWLLPGILAALAAMALGAAHLALQKRGRARRRTGEAATGIALGALALVFMFVFWPLVGLLADLVR